MVVLPFSCSFSGVHSTTFKPGAVYYRPPRSRPFVRLGSALLPSNSEQRASVQEPIGQKHGKSCRNKKSKFFTFTTERDLWGPIEKSAKFWEFLMILMELGHLGQHAQPGNPWGDACKRRRWITSAFRTQKICDLRRATAWNLGPSHSAAFSRLFCRRQTCWCAMRAACEQRTIFGCTARSNRYAWAWLIAFHSLQSWYFAVSNSYTHPSTFCLERSIFLHVFALWDPFGMF